MFLNGLAFEEVLCGHQLVYCCQLLHEIKLQLRAQAVASKCGYIDAQSTNHFTSEDRNLIY